jgi:hypothetical protein
MIIEGNAMGRHPGEEGVPQGLPMSPILFVSYTSGLIKCVVQYISAKVVSFVNNPGCMATGSDIN